MRTPIAWWLACAVACVASSAAADSPRAAGRVVVRFTPGAAVDEQARFAAAVRAELAGVAPLDVDLREALVVVHVTWARGGATLTFEDASGGQAAPPRTVTGTTPDVIAAEAASIVRSTAIALREAALDAGPRDAPVAASAPVVSVPSPPLPPPERLVAIAPVAVDVAPAPVAPVPPSWPVEPPVLPDVVPTTRPPPRSRLAVDAAYAGTVYAANVPWRSGLRVDALVRLAEVGRAKLYAGALYGFDPALGVSSGGVTVTTTRHTAAALAGVATVRGRLGVAVDAGPVVTVTARTAEVTSAGLAATSGDTLISTGAMLRGLASLRVGPRTHLDASGGLTVILPGEAYVVDLAGQSAILAPYRVQPSVSLGMGYDLW